MPVTTMTCMHTIVAKWKRTHIYIFYPVALNLSPSKRLVISTTRGLKKKHDELFSKCLGSNALSRKCTSRLPAAGWQETDGKEQISMH